MARTLGLDYYKLRQRSAGCSLPREGAPAFVELQVAPALGPSGVEASVELSDGTGARIYPAGSVRSRLPSEGLARDIASIRDGFADYLRTRHYAPSTVEHYQRHLVRVACWLRDHPRHPALEALTRPIVARLLAHVLPQGSLETRMNYRKAVFHWLRFRARYARPIARPWAPWLHDYLQAGGAPIDCAIRSPPGCISAVWTSNPLRTCSDTGNWIPPTSTPRWISRPYAGWPDPGPPALPAHSPVALSHGRPLLCRAFWSAPAGVRRRCDFSAVGARDPPATVLEAFRVFTICAIALPLSGLHVGAADRLPWPTAWSFCPVTSDIAISTTRIGMCSPSPRRSNTPPVDSNDIVATCP